MNKFNLISFFSFNKFNLISFHEKDHGERDGSSLEQWVKKNLEQNKIETVDIKIKLLCYPRIFGYGFHEDGIKSSIEMLKYLND